MQPQNTTRPIKVLTPAYVLLLVALYRIASLLAWYTHQYPHTHTDLRSPKKTPHTKNIESRLF